MIRRSLFRALSPGIPKTRYEAKENVPESEPVTPRQPTPSISQVDGSSAETPQGGVTIPSQTSTLQRKITGIMRKVPSALTIILSEAPRRSRTSLSPLNSELDMMASPPREPTGLLVSSFNTVTISSIPIVSFNIKLPSRTHSAILASGTFSASGINNAELAQNFLLPPGSKKSHMIKACTLATEDGAPRLKAGQGGVWWMHCRWVREKSVQIGDHAIMVGEVVSTGKYGERDKSKSLFYLNGAYRECVNYSARDGGIGTLPGKEGAQRNQRIETIPSKDLKL